MFMYFYLLLTRGNCVTQLRSFPAMTAIHSIEQLSDAVDIVNEHVQESGHSTIHSPDEGLEKATLVREKERKTRSVLLGTGSGGEKETSANDIYADRSFRK